MTDIPPNDLALLKETAEEMMGLLAHHDFIAINNKLRDTDWSTLPTILLGAIPRYSFIARQWLPDWKEAVVKVTAELERRGLDAARIMQGLNR